MPMAKSSDAYGNVSPGRAAAGSPPVSLWPLVVAIVVVGAPMFWGALEAYPLYDDGWLLMMLREGAPGQLAAAMPDRPLFGRLVGFLASAWGSSPLFFVSLSMLLCAVYAFQVGLLWRRVFPDMKQYGCLAGAMAMSTLLVQAQLCTLLVELPCVAPAIAVLGGLLLLLRGVEGSERTWRVSVLLASALIVSGVLFSEYAVASAAAGITILGGMYLSAEEPVARTRLRWALAAMAIATAASYVVFLQMTNLTVSRPSVSPNNASAVMRKNPISVVTNLLNGVWYAALGAAAKAAGQVSLDWSSRFTVLATAYGAMSAGLLWWLLPKPDLSGVRPSASRIHPGALVLAVAAGLLPVAMMGRGTALTGFGSRFLLPVVPAASIALLVFLFHLVRSRWTRVVVAAIGLITAHASFSTAVAARREARQIDALGDSLAPYVSGGSEYTVAVLSQSGMDYELTARVSRRWPLEQARSFWMFDLDSGPALYGPRRGCVASPRIEKDLRTLRRFGAVSSLLWVEYRNGHLISIEPYCQEIGR